MDLCFRKMKRYYLIAIILVIALVIFIIVVPRSKKVSINPVNEKTDTEDSTVYRTGVTKIEPNQKPVETIVQAKSEKIVGDPPAMTDDVLTIVDDVKITKKQLDSIFNTMPSQIKEYYKDDKPGFLEELVTRQLLISEAKRQKIYNQEDYKDYVKQNPDKKEDIMVNLLLKKIANSVTLSENDLKDFYNQYKDQLPNKDYESVKEQLRPMALEEKQRLKIDDFINSLKSKAKIVRNEKWIKEQELATADNPLSKALKSKRPVLADFGRGTCIPCKMMQPILEKLQKEYAGKAEILIIDVGEYAALARKYKIMIIPTQIFFDSSGKEVYRHQGFMPEQDIVAQLKRMGVE